MALTNETKRMAEALARLAHQHQFGFALDDTAKKTVDLWVDRRWRDYQTDAQFVMEALGR